MTLKLWEKKELNSESTLCSVPAACKQSRSLLQYARSTFCLNKQELVIPSRKAWFHLWIFSYATISPALPLCEGNDENSVSRGGMCALLMTVQLAIPEPRSCIPFSREHRASQNQGKLEKAGQPKWIPATRRRSRKGLPLARHKSSCQSCAQRESQVRGRWAVLNLSSHSNQE